MIGDFSMKLDFYYWGYQCPINYEILTLMKDYEYKIDIVLHDITDRPDIARSYRMFFPTLTIIDGKYRYFSPISIEFLNEVSDGNIPIEKPYTPVLGLKPYRGEILQIEPNNLWLSSLCTGRDSSACCMRKADFLCNLGLNIYGFMNVQNGELLGGAEYVPSTLVPYDIPKNGEIAFITCVYLSSEKCDYKSAPLQALELYLKSNYKSVIVISDEIGVFPNGNLDFFVRNGYTDMGIISEEPGYCCLHMLMKNLK